MKQITDDWWIGLNGSYRTEEVDGDLLFLKPGRTVKVALWSADAAIPMKTHIDAWIAERGHEKARELFRDDAGEPARYAYKLTENLADHTHIYEVHGVTICQGQMVDLTVVVDLREHLDWAEALARHISFGGADAAYQDLDSSGPDGLTAVGSARICSTDLHFPIRLAYRDVPADADDSGWRFMHGSEDEAFCSDEHNFRRMRLGEFLQMDNELRRIISNPVGTRWEREDKDAPWHVVKDAQ